MPTTRRRVPRYRNPGLTLELADLLLTGDTTRTEAELADLARQGIAYDAFVMFDYQAHDPRLADLWHQHGAALLAEWKRRGLTGQPWFTKSDGPGR